jgi:hypothetical protein
LVLADEFVLRAAGWLLQGSLATRMREQGGAFVTEHFDET